MKTQIIHKNFDSSLKTIKGMSSPLTLKINGGPDFWNAKEMEIRKENEKFKIKIHFTNSDKVYYNSILHTKIDSYELNGDARSYYIPEKATHRKSFRPLNNELDPDFNFLFEGEIHQLGNEMDLKNFDGKFHRLIIPIVAGESILADFQTLPFNSDIPLNEKSLIKIEFEKLSFHFFSFNIDNNWHWGIDSMQIMDFEKFKSAAFAALAAYGFIKGNLFLRESYYFASDSTDFIAASFHYMLLRESLQTRFGIFTTNPFIAQSIFDLQKGQQTNTSAALAWNKRFRFFSSLNFSKLTELFYNNETFSRSAFIMLEANNQPLELKSASYCVAYEGICHAIKKVIDIKAPSVIDKTVWENNIKQEFEKLLSKLRDDKHLDNSQYNILSSKITNLNQPTNRDSLMAPFLRLGYTLNNAEIGCIDNRNKFLHGSLPFKSADEDQSFKILYFNAVTIHKLIHILVLKLIGFDGYIINYPKIYEEETGQILNEELFIKI